VVRQGNAVGRVDVEGLRFRRAGRARRRITHMANAHVADQPAHMPVAEHVAHHAVVLAQEQAVTVAGDNAGSVLAALLRNREAIINCLVDVGTANDANNTAHSGSPLSGTKAKDEVYKV